MVADDWLDLPDLVDKVQELIELGFIDDAKEMLDNYKMSFYDYWELHFLYSRVFMEQNLPREAISCLITALRMEYDNVDCLLGMFYAFAMMNQVKRGGKYLLQAEALERDNDMVLSALIWYYTEMNEPEKAIGFFERAQKISTNNPDVYRNAGIAFSRLERLEEAEACYKAALLLSPGFEEARDMYADHLIFSDKVDDAVKLYEDALKESPKNIRHISKLIYCLSQKGDFEKAEELAKHSISLYPNTPLGYIDLAYVNLNTNNLEEAAENADKAISVSPIDAEGYRVKAIACSEGGDYAAADELFDRAVSLDHDNVDIMRDYYRHLRVAGKYEEMIDLVNRVIKIDTPYCVEDYCFMADYYRDKKQNAKAFRYLRLAHDSMPSERELLPPMIEILLEQGHTKYSLPIFAKYVQKSGWTDTISGLTANRQFRSGRMQEGMRFLRFTGQRPAEFRKHVFRHYLRRYAFIYYTIIFVALLFPASVLSGWPGVGGVAATYAASTGLVKLWQFIKTKKSAARKRTSP
jgi:tetratricopeptide (TPR) repeat protein